MMRVLEGTAQEVYRALLFVVFTVEVYIMSLIPFAGERREWLAGKPCPLKGPFEGASHYCALMLPCVWHLRKPLGGSCSACCAEQLQEVHTQCCQRGIEHNISA